jgi:hypothetical protein
MPCLPKRERVEVVGAIALQCPSYVIGDRSLLPETVGADEDMHDAAVGERIPFPPDSDRGHHRWRCDPLGYVHLA